MILGEQENVWKNAWSSPRENKRSRPIFPLHKSDKYVIMGVDSCEVCLLDLPLAG